VREGYARVAREDFSDRAEAISRIATAFGYGADDLAALPDGANMGLSCGNPVALASLKEGETVVDLGSGGGLDVFLASRAVGPEGRAIGIDMTEDMVALARRNAAAGGYTNVEFHLAPLESMPLASESVDCVISNCVLNLVDDKDAALKEIFRVLKPGGRLAVSDITLQRPLPSQIASDLTAWVSCFAGAISIESNLEKLKRAGFGHAQVVPSGADLNVYKEGGSAGCCAPKPVEEPASACCEPKSAGNAKDECCTPKASPDDPGCCTPAPAADGQSGCCSQAAETEPESAGFHDKLTQSLSDLDLNAYAAAVRIFAVKPGGSRP
jgi:SAM-dependent methyltransferase